MLVEIHMIQNHAPSNLNRDDTGSPKDALFGGVLRARISSQCLKRSIRNSQIFREAMEGHFAWRTKRLPMKIREHLESNGCAEEDAIQITKKLLILFEREKDSDADNAVDKGLQGGEDDEIAENLKELTTGQVLFVTPDEIPRLANALRDLWVTRGSERFKNISRKDLEKSLINGMGYLVPRSVDIALFGRMVTSKVFNDPDAAIQVAHAISTGKVEKQFDYFTAVDDLREAADEAGAAMIGDVEFNSATYYKYFALDWDSFVANLGGDVATARQALVAFLRAAALTTPTGKQNTFAAHNAPDAILIEVKKELTPLSYANAFLKPVRAQGGQDIVELSIKALSDYSSQLKSAYSIHPERSLYMTVRGEEIADAERVVNIDGLVEGLLAALRQASEEEVVAS